MAIVLSSAFSPFSDNAFDLGASPPPSNSVEPKPSPLDLSLAAHIPDATSEVFKGLGPVSPSLDIVKAALHFSSQDRIDAVAERKRNLELMDCLAAHGISIQDINAYVQTGAIARVVDAQNVLVKSPQGDVASSFPVKVPDTDYEKANSSTLLNDAHQLFVVSPKRAVSLSSLPHAPSTVTHSKSWSSVVADGGNRACCNLEFLPPAPPSSEDGPIIIKPPTDFLKQGNRLWNSSLVGGFMNSRLPFKLVADTAHSMWNKYGLQKVFMQEKGLFVFKFSSPAERDNVLALGPWYISNKLIVLKHWKEGMVSLFESCTTTPVWVKFFNIPMSYLSPKGLSFIASAVGKPLFVDKVTEKLEPMNFARVCIEITTASALPDNLVVTIFDDDTGLDKLVDVRVEYQNKPSSCSHCNSFGHSSLKCPSANYMWVRKAPATSPSKPVQPLNLGSLSSLDSDPLANKASMLCTALPPIPIPFAPSAPIALRSILKHKDRNSKISHCSSSATLAPDLPILNNTPLSHNDWTTITKGSKYSPPPLKKGIGTPVSNSFSPIAAGSVEPLADPVKPIDGNEEREDMLTVGEDPINPLPPFNA